MSKHSEEVRRWNTAHPGLANERRRAAHRANPGRNAAYLRASRRADPRRSMLYSARKRAKQDETAFSLTLEDIPTNTTCAYTGVPLVVGNGKGPQPNSPSLDRIDPTKGYVRGNVAVISYRANRIKQDATPQELRLIADAVDRLLAK